VLRFVMRKIAICLVLGFALLGCSKVSDSSSDTSPATSASPPTGATSNDSNTIFTRKARDTANKANAQSSDSTGQ